MGVSEREREHLRRLGEHKARTHAAAAAAHATLSVEDRLARSVALMKRFYATARARHDDPTPFYERARSLGLYRR